MAAMPAGLDDVVLHTENLILRPLRRSDAPAIVEAMQDPSMHQFLPLPQPYTAREAHTYIEDVALAARAAGRALECGLEQRGTGHLVGTASLFLPAARSRAGEIGYAIYPTGRGRGYAAEATRALTTWGFTVNLARVELRVAVGNQPSLRVALAAGFRYEGVERASIRVPSGTADGAVFGRVPGDPDDPIRPALPPLGALGDGTVGLRQLTPEDLDLVRAEAADPDVARWALSPTDDARLRSTAGRSLLDWLVGPHFRMVILDARTGAKAGHLSFYNGGPPGVMIVGYSVLAPFRGRGFTGRALRLLSAWAFDVAGLAVLELGAAVDNVASQKAAVAGGFRPDGIARGRLRRPDGSYADEARFALTNPAYETSRISP